MTYANVVSAVSRPLDVTILEQMPVALVVLRASDQVVVYGNEKALRHSGYSESDFGTLTLWDVLVDDDTVHAADEAAKGINKRASEDGDPSEGFVRFRSKSGTVSTYWFTIKDIVDPDGIVRYRAVLGFLDYDQRADDENWQEYINKVVDTAVRRMAGTFASELNNALAVLRMSLESKGLLNTADDSINQALVNVIEIGSKLSVHGSDQFMQANWPATEAMLLANQQTDEQQVDSSSTRVLVVDDDEILLETLKDLLLVHGMRVNTATTTQSAVEAAQQFSPDVALIDLRLGSEDGRDTAKLLVESFPSVQIIFMTGFANSLREIHREGKYIVLKKPFQINSLISHIRNKVST